MNPAAHGLFSNPKLYPLPNAPGTGPFGFSSNYISTSGTNLDNDQADAKIDYHHGEKDYIFGRFTIERYRDGTTAVAIPTFLGSATDAPTTGGVISWTHTISPTTLNEARVGFTRVKINNTTTDPGSIFGPNGNSLLGYPGRSTYPWSQ